MLVYRGIPVLPEGVKSAVAIGNFDGVHIGHQVLLKAAARRAEASGGDSVALTFEPHPRECFSPGAAPARITPLRDKAAAVAACGVTRLCIANFSKKLASLPAEEFVREILVKRLHAFYVTVGGNFTFGARGTAGPEELKRICAKYGVEADVKTLLNSDGASVSSSRIRGLLQAGELEEAARLLGRPYAMTGRVVRGAQLGRTIGFPTLNLRVVPPGSKSVPALAGVFATRVKGLGPEPLFGVTSLGNRPTVAGGTVYTCETNVLGWSGDAYGKVVTVEFAEKLRDNKKFSGLEELRAAISSDADRARRIFGLPRAPKNPKPPKG